MDAQYTAPEMPSFAEMEATEIILPLPCSIIILQAARVMDMVPFTLMLVTKS